MTTRPDKHLTEAEAPITLADACDLFPSSKFKVSTLRAEAARGRLCIFRIGRRDYTTEASIREMVRKCQDAARHRGSTSTRSATSGLSETDRISSARAALNQTVVELRKGSRRTWDENTNRSAAPRR